MHGETLKFVVVSVSLLALFTGVYHVQVAVKEDGTRVDEIRSPHVEELDTAAKAPNPNGGGDTRSSRTGVAPSVDQKPRHA